MEAVKDPLQLMEIEKELAGPDKDAAMARYDAVLAGLDRRIDAAMKEGLPPDGYPKVEFLTDRPGGRVDAEDEAERRRSTTTKSKRRN